MPRFAGGGLRADASRLWFLVAPEGERLIQGFGAGNSNFA